MIKEAVELNEYAEFELTNSEHLTAVAGGDIVIYGIPRRNVTCSPLGINYFFCNVGVGSDDPVVNQSVPFVGVYVNAPSTSAQVTVPGVISTANGGYLYLGANGVGGLYVNGACIDNIKCGSNVPC